MHVLEALRYFFFPWNTCHRDSAFLTEDTLRLPPLGSRQSATLAEIPNRQTPNPTRCEEDDLIFDLDYGFPKQLIMTHCNPHSQHLSELLSTSDPYLIELRAMVGEFLGASIDEIGQHLALNNYAVVQRMSHHHNGLSMFKLKNRFLVVFRRKLQSSVWDGLTEEIIIEPDFRSHFVVGFRQAVYDAFLEELPKTVIAQSSTFEELVQLGAAQMEQAFLRQGEIIPPWRTHTAALSLWFAQDMCDHPVPFEDLSGAPVSTHAEVMSQDHFKISLGHRGGMQHSAQ